MNKIIKIISFIFIAIVLTTIKVYSQDGFGEPGEDVPIDGGLSLLVAAGVGYGAKKINDARKKKNEEKEVE